MNHEHPFDHLPPWLRQLVESVSGPMGQPGRGRPVGRPGRGFPAGGPPPFGGGEWMRRGFWGGGFGTPWAQPAQRASRGDIRNAILVLLTDEPMHGYQLMQQMAERSGGAWRPSPGSVYPTLSQLEDEGLV